MKAPCRPVGTSIVTLLALSVTWQGVAGPARAADVLPAPRGVAVYRPSTQDWLLREANGAATTVHFGDPGDQPVPADYLNLGQPQIAVFRPTTREWLIRRPTGTTFTWQFGGPGDVPVPGDYLGAGYCQIAVFRPSSQGWLIRRDDGATIAAQFGGPGDQPEPGDYLGMGRTQIAVFRPATAEWFVRTDEGTLPIQWGAPGDVPVAADYLGEGRRQIAVFRPSTREWFIRHGDATGESVAFGGPDDQPVPADYFGLGHAQVAVYRPETSEWFLRTDAGETVSVQLGGPGDQAITAGFAPSFGSWMGTLSGIRERLGLVIQTPEQWIDWWNTVRAAEVPPPPVPAVDFRRQMVVAVFQGERPSGGYAISIADIRYGDTEIQVDVSQRQAASDELTPQIMTQPFHMVIARQSGLPVRFLGMDFPKPDDDKKVPPSEF